MPVDEIRARQEPNIRQVAGACEQCGEPFRGRQGKRFCRDACRTKFGRKQKARAAATGRERFDQAVRQLLAAADALSGESDANIKQTRGTRDTART